MAVFDAADDIDQLALALSCKHLLQASTLVSLKTSASAGRDVNPYRLRAMLIQLLSPTTNAWKICTVCTFYRLTGKGYWKAKVDLPEWDFLKAKEARLMAVTISDWKHDRKTTYCPKCLWERLELELYNKLERDQVVTIAPLP